MNESQKASVAAHLESSLLLKRGRADVFRQRERTRRRKVLRMFLLVGSFDAYLWYRLATHDPLRLPSMPADWGIYLPIFVMVGLLGVMMLVPMLSGRSPHLMIHPEQVEVGLTEISGLDTQVDEVLRSLDVFLGYATFREELGGTPRRGILFEGPPGTGKTYLAKAMAKQAGVPFLFMSASATQSMWFGGTASRIRSFFKALRKAARKEGGAIGFIEEIDAIGGSRDGLGMSPAPANLSDGLARTVSNMISSGTGGMVNELLIQMQSFDQPPRLERIRSRIMAWINTYLPPERRLKAGKPAYNNILLIAATNRADTLDSALLRPGRFDRRLYFDLPSKQGRLDLIEFFMQRKAHDPEMDEPSVRQRLAHDTFGYTPVMLEHLFDESLLIALRDGQKSMTLDHVYEAKLTDEIGIKQPVVYTDVDRAAVATHEAGHATVAYFLGKGKRLEVLSIIKRRDSLGLLAHGDEEEHFTRTRTEVEAAIAIALGGLVAEELCLGESGTGPASDLAYATGLAAQMVGSFGMAGSLISYEAIAQGAVSQTNLVAKVLGDGDGKRRVDDILEAQRGRVREVLEENQDVHAALRDALIERDELVRDEISSVIEKAFANRN
ncbi:MAG: AAA family ATPase [Actinomycetota bacterium]